MADVEPLKDATNLKHTDSNTSDQANKSCTDKATATDKNSIDLKEAKNEANNSVGFNKESKTEKTALFDIEILKSRLTETECKLMEKTVQLHVILRVLEKYRKKCSVTDRKLKKIIETAVSKSDESR